MLLSLSDVAPFLKSRKKASVIIIEWSREIPATYTSDMVDITNMSACQMYHYFCDVCSWKLLSSPCLLGGPGCVVQIDESCVSKRQKVWLSDLGLWLVLELKLWVVFLLVPSRRLSTSSLGFWHDRDEGRRSCRYIFLRFVERRNRQTLDPLINQHLRPHSTVWSDQFKAYFHLQALENVDSHLTVNHSVHFLDPETGVHTNGIEGLWGLLKLLFRRKIGIPREQIPGYIDEFWWKQRYGTSQKRRSWIKIWDAVEETCRINELPLELRGNGRRSSRPSMQLDHFIVMETTGERGNAIASEDPRSLQIPHVRLLLQRPKEAVRRPMPTPLH